MVSFDEFENNTAISERHLQDYQSKYIDLYQSYAKKDKVEKERINEDLVFEIELIKQVEVNIDYILMLVIKYHESNCEDKTILTSINKAINASIQLRSKKELIEGFIEQMTMKKNVSEDWLEFVHNQREKDIDAIIKEEKLKEEGTKKFIENAFRDGEIKTIGTDIDSILPPVSRFSKDGNRAQKKEAVIEKLKKFFDKYFGLF